MKAFDRPLQKRPISLAAASPVLTWKKSFQGLGCIYMAVIQHTGIDTHNILLIIFNNKILYML
jgi:hypothetical protein